jgi:hypothetical protein
MSRTATTDAEDTTDSGRLRTTLQAVAARLGKTPTVVDFHEDPETDVHPEAYTDAFGDWESALDAAGLDPDEMGSKQITDHELLAELQRLYTQLGRSPSQQDMEAYGAYSDTSYKNRFGSWNNALQEAMLDTNAQFNEISENELLAELERLADELCRVPVPEEMDELGEYGVVTYHRRFGSWRQALDAADFS